MLLVVGLSLGIAGARFHFKRLFVVVDIAEIFLRPRKVPARTTAVSNRSFIGPRVVAPLGCEHSSMARRRPEHDVLRPGRLLAFGKGRYTRLLLVYRELLRADPDLINELLLFA